MSGLTMRELRALVSLLLGRNQRQEHLIRRLYAQNAQLARRNRLLRRSTTYSPRPQSLSPRETAEMQFSGAIHGENTHGT